jgi:hypothetical protein
VNSRKPLIKEDITMRPKTFSLLFLMIFLLPVFAGAVSEKDFEAQTSENMINLCTVAPDDPLYQQAINFCHGYLVGAFDYHEAASRGPEGVRLVCAPDPRPSRNAMIEMFIDWAKAHPEYWNEPPVETEFRFLMEKWPCKP